MHLRQFSAIAVLALSASLAFGGASVSVFPVGSFVPTGEDQDKPAGPNTYNLYGPPTPPAGWQLSALNGIWNEGWWHWGPAFFHDDGDNHQGFVVPPGRPVFRFSCESPYGSRVYPYWHQTGYRPIKTSVATNLQYVYDLTNFPSDEIAIGVVLRIKHYNVTKVQGDALVSLSLPGGPGIALVAGAPGTSYNADIGNLPSTVSPPSYQQHGFHLYQFRQAPPYDPDGNPPSPPDDNLAINVNSLGGRNRKINLQGSTQLLATLMIKPEPAIHWLGDGNKWITSYHTFWLYVNKSNKRILAKMDNLPTVDLTLTPLTMWNKHDQLPQGQWTNDPAVYAWTLATDWDTTGFAQFGARDYHVHAEYPEWVGPSSAGFWYNWWGDWDQSGENNPEPYDSRDSIVYFGGGANDGVLNGNAAVLTTDWSVTPFAADLVCSHVPFADVDADGDVDQADFSFFQTCFTGADNPLPTDPARLYCKCFDKADINGGATPDGRLTAEDLTVFSKCATGPGIPWAPTADCP